MEGRLSLDELLRATLGNRVHYYFQPPTGYQIEYPALIYRLDGFQDMHSNNRVYNRRHAYYLLLILDEPDNSLAETLDDLPYCHMSRTPYVNDNLYHYPFTIYY